MNVVDSVIRYVGIPVQRSTSQRLELVLTVSIARSTNKIAQTYRRIGILHIPIVTMSKQLQN